MWYNWIVANQQAKDIGKMERFIAVFEQEGGWGIGHGLNLTK